MWHRNNSEKDWNSSEHRYSNSAPNISHRLCWRTIPFSWFAFALLKHPGDKNQKIIKKIIAIKMQFSHIWHYSVRKGLELNILPFFLTGSLRNHDDEGNTNLHIWHIWQWKTVSLHALTCIFHLLIFWRRSRSFYEVKWAVFQLCGRREHMMTNVQFCMLMLNFVCLCPKRWLQFYSRMVRTHFSSIMTLNNWKNDCRNAKLHFQTFSLPSTSCLLNP